MWYAPLLALGLASGIELELDVTLEPADGGFAGGPLLVQLEIGDELPADWTLPRGALQARFIGDDAPVVAVSSIAATPRRPGGLALSWHEGPLTAACQRVLVIERPLDPVQPRVFEISNDEASGERVLRFDGDVLLAQAHAFDDERFEETYKVYDHLYGFAGERLTKPHGGLYPHHRGVFLGWAKTRHNGQSHDFWHNAAGQHASQRSTLVHHFDGGPSHASILTTNTWFTTNKELLVKDLRRIVAHRPRRGERVFDYDLRVTAKVDGVVLDGDPPHAGFQIRAAQEVAERKDCTYVLPEGAVNQGNDNWTNARWVAARFLIEGEPVTIVQMEHPDNPGDTIWNTRNYGRFGAFARHELSRAEPLELRYRILVLDAPPVRDALDAAWRAWTSPPSIQVRVR